MNASAPSEELQAEVRRLSHQVRVLQEQMREVLSLEVPLEATPANQVTLPAPRPPEQEPQEPPPPQKQTSPSESKPKGWEVEAQAVVAEPSVAPPSTVGERMELALRGANQTLKDRLLFVGDRFHNLYELRQPSAVGLIVTAILPPAMIVYIIYWIIKYNGDPPLEEVNTFWSMSYAPFPLYLECKSEHCWYSLSDCVGSNGAENTVCTHATKDETVMMQMCPSLEPSGGLHLVWSNSTAQDDAPQIKAWVYTGNSEPVARSLRVSLHPGLQLGTYVHTWNFTLAEGEDRRESHEWFSTYVSPMTSPMTKPGGCDSAIAAAPEAKASAHFSMEPSFVERKIEKPAPYGPFIGDVGGTYSLLSSLLLGAYLVLWRGSRAAKTARRSREGSEK